MSFDYFFFNSVVVIPLPRLERNKGLYFPDILQLFLFYLPHLYLVILPINLCTIIKLLSNMEFDFDNTVSCRKYVS